jgi:hypothetical protein
LPCVRRSGNAKVIHDTPRKPLQTGIFRANSFAFGFGQSSQILLISLAAGVPVVCHLVAGADRLPTT